MPCRAGSTQHRTSRDGETPPVRFAVDLVVTRASEPRAMAAAAAAAEGRQQQEQETRVCDLPEECLALAIALTSPRDASRCAAVSPAFRAAADSDHVWQRFIPTDDGSFLLPGAEKKRKKKKDAYLGLCDAVSAVAVGDDDGGCRVWLDRATGARCYALSARRLSLPWDDGEFSWRFTPHPLSRFGEVAELVECTCLDIYGRLPTAALTPATPYAAYLIYNTAPEGQHRGLSFLDQETSVSLGGSMAAAARHAVCLRPDDAEARKFRGGGGGGEDGQVRRPRRREDGWWEMEMGRLPSTATGGEPEPQEVVASFEALGWYPKRGLILHGIEFRPLH
ncbi:hypothetical protein SEVIR_6G061600v4 [Setaria viridis]|uniref:F-box domain-containing protein n=1 Tax=Setaria viridis TaxID=4556 RepID=A0A4U6U4C3_SETVI|nr:putative F-box protein PP2-B8 [Setaria viridis]TKW08984.1 hypothetical protein SEVIR_6G061600v2 [Setaria viridis]